MCKMIDQYADKIKGTFSFFDRMIINGYIRPLFLDWERQYGLSKPGVLYKDFKSYVMNVTDSIKSNIEDSAAELGRPVEYFNSPKSKKEDYARAIVERDSIKDGLICVIKTQELCRSAKAFGSDDGKLVMKTVNTKCLHCYLYYQDAVFGVMFVKIQTWFPFNIQIYINGREWMKSVFRSNGIDFQCCDNSFTHISDPAKAQGLADRFDSEKLCRLPDRFAKSINPFLDNVYEKPGQGSKKAKFKGQPDIEEAQAAWSYQEGSPFTPLSCHSKRAKNNGGFD